MVKYWKLFESRSQCHARIRNWNNNTMWPLHSTPEADDYYCDVIFVFLHLQMKRMQKKTINIERVVPTMTYNIICKSNTRKKIGEKNTKKIDLFTRDDYCSIMRKSSQHEIDFSHRPRRRWWWWRRPSGEAVGHQRSGFDHDPLIIGWKWSQYAYVQKRKFHKKKNNRFRAIS